MDATKIREAVFATLRAIAPEVDPAALVADRPLRDQVDLDSMDWLNFLVGLNRTLAIEIPERDYPKLDTLEHLLVYLRSRLEQAS